MKILFEEYAYRFPYIQEIHLCPYFFFSDDGQEAWIPYVGYYFSQEINDSVFILPKVFLFEGEGDAGNGEIAFGKYRPEDIINPEGKDNPLMKDGFDNVVFNLSVWLYQAISRYQRRHPYSGIISDAKIQNVISRRGEAAETYLDIVLSLLRFGKKHSGLFTYITILNSSGNDRIHWGKTVSRVTPTLQGRTPLYMEFINRNRSVNYDEQLVVLFYSVLNYLHSLRYRDELTEGYNITPNFFIRGSIRTDSIAGGKFDFKDDCLENEGKALPDNKHFRNRLFDRDTLILQSYNINFLYVLNAYAFSSSDTGFKEKARRRFRADVISEFNRRYDFYTVTPRKGMGLSDFVSRHFKLLNGKIYRASDTDGFVYLALEHDLPSENLTILDVVREDAVVERVRL